ncbi:DNA polymerase IV [Labedella populi]|uniref:DNA polymerase IV n=1 Tax=Labedella populi TaxID=2498850 RepID=A0A3S4AJ23_9MICO|nr:DNA polymerase IV [Labedella populi]RWZ61175.1 DNA polymerase IV [Labedella populi]
MGRDDGAGRQVTVGAADDSAAPILHIDMDAFFASVELLERPELRGKPVIIGHRDGRSVVTSATYEARKFGVGAAMPVSKALRLCPQAVVVPPNYAAYTHFSREVMRIFSDITPLVEQLSIDEAFLDVSGARRLLGPPAAIARLVRERVVAETGLTCSVGVAASKFVAKMASTRAKPDGLLVVPKSETLAFLHPLPIRTLWGVGPSTEESLRRLGLATIGDIAEIPIGALRAAVGVAGAEKLSQLARGHDPRPVETSRVEKSIGHEVTFHTDVADIVQLRVELLRLADKVAVRLRERGWVARTVGLKVRWSDFTTLSRSHTLPEPTSVGRRLHEEAVGLLEALQPLRPVRLVGIRAEQLTHSGDGALLWDPDEDWREAEQSVDAVRKRFGTAALAPASLLGGPRGAVGGTRTQPFPED